MIGTATRPPCNTGPIELRDFGPLGGRLGTAADCYDGSPWELHHGELIEQMGSKDIHGIVMALFAKLFGIHVAEGITVMTDVYCDLSDEQDQSFRAPDVVVVRDLQKPRDAAYEGIPVVAVEIRGTQSKKYLEEKVRLYLDHGWPQTWIAYPLRMEIEVFEKGLGSVVYRVGSSVPLPAEMRKYGLERIPVEAFFDEEFAVRWGDYYVRAIGKEEGEVIGQERGEVIGQERGEVIGRAKGVVEVLEARGFVVPDALRQRILACTEPSELKTWLGKAVSCVSMDAISSP